MNPFFPHAIVHAEESMKICAVCFLLTVFLAPCALFAQASYDPNDALYRYLDVWEGRGVLESLPRLRPYSAEVLRELLRNVVERGTTDDARVAKEFLGEVSGVALHAHASQRSEARDVTYFGRSGVGAHMLVQMFPQASVGGRVDFWFVDGKPEAVQPIGERTDFELDEDPSTAYAHVLGRDLLLRLSSAFSLSVGDRTLSLQAGLNRSSFGPFFDNGLVVGPQAPVAGTLTLNWDLDAVRIYYGLFELTQRIPPKGGLLQTGKYLALHGVEVLPLPWLTLDAFEMVVWSGRFEPLYLIPVSDFFYTQSLNGFTDNSLLGVAGTARISTGIEFKGMLIADDSHKFAGQAGIVWAPASEVLRNVALDYTVVTPYTYTHKPNEINQSIDYTNWDVNEGPALEPNSDRIEARAFLTPLPSLELTAQGRFIRHGNASEDYIGAGDAQDHSGTISDPGYVGTEPIFAQKLWNALSFLTERTIDMSLQVGLGAAWRLRAGWGSLRLSARYLFELRLNEGLASGTTGAHNFISLGAEYSY